MHHFSLSHKMREKRDYLIITFKQTENAIMMEKRAKEKGVSGRIIPLPSEISAGCGMAWKAEVEEKISLIHFMNEEGIVWEGDYIVRMY